MVSDNVLIWCRMCMHGKAMFEKLCGIGNELHIHTHLSHDKIFSM